MPVDRFDGRTAVQYDMALSEMFEPRILDPTVDFLADLAGDGAVLEFGVGTGRVALPLSERGVRVHGIDLSPAMLEQLRAKPGSDVVEVTVGDFATTRVGSSFRLVYLVYNTITNLTSQDEQVACFQNAAAHLAPGGCFVVETYVPHLRRLPPGETTRAFAVAPGYVGVDEYTDIPAQILHSHHYRVVDSSLELFSAPYRYVWPAELDLMARLAGLHRRERWSTWAREPFTGESTSQVSVWAKPEVAGR